jgi:mRNA interferase MazF
VRRGELYRVQHPTSQDTKRQRVFVIVGRQVVIDSKLSTIICAPVYSSYDHLSTQVPVGPDEGLKHDSSIHCDELISLSKSRLMHYVGALSSKKMQILDISLKVALHLDQE